MIGVFDSGIGGLSVLKAIREKMPHADIVYFGDTENAPYGNKSKREITELIAMALKRLHAEDCSDIVSACNSASVSVHSIPIDLLRLNIFNVVEMIEPTVEALSSYKKIALFGTQATIDSHIYQDAFKKKGISVDPIAIPKLAGLIEKGASKKEMREVIVPAVEKAVRNNPDVVSLSCTHFPFARPVFEECLKEVGSRTEVFDPAKAVAEEVKRRFDGNGSGGLRFIVSKKTSVFSSQVLEIFGPEYIVEEASSIYWAL